MGLFIYIKLSVSTRHIIHTHTIREEDAMGQIRADR